MESSHKIEGLAKETAEVYEDISKMDCLKGLYLCGGTSVALQIHHRLSEDLDFELIGTRKDRPKLAYGEIINEVCEKFPHTEKDMLGDDHFQLFLPNRVKLSFFRPAESVPSLSKGYTHNNITTPSLQDLLGMKIFATTVRTVYRDYYDIYCLLEAGLNFQIALKYALDFTRHRAHTKSVLSTLITPQLFVKESDFDERLQPKYNVSPEEVCERIKVEVRAKKCVLLNTNIQ